jgi:hypothetical protein
MHVANIGSVLNLGIRYVNGVDVVYSGSDKNTPQKPPPLLASEWALEAQETTELTP